MRNWVICGLVVCLAAVCVLVLILDGSQPPEKPVKGVNVGVESGEISFSNGDQRETLRAGQKARVDSKGLFAMEPTPGAPTEIPFPDLLATTKGVGDGTPTESKPANENIQYGIKEGFWIAGFSKTQDGAFVPGAEITVEKKSEDKGRWGVRLVTSATFTAQTDDHGHYEVQTDGPAKYELRSHAPEYFGEYIDAFGKVELTEMEKTKPLDFVHRPGSGYWIVGTVKSEDGVTIAGSKISAYLDASTPGRYFNTQSNSEGSYELKVPGPGKYAIRSDPPGEYIPDSGVAILEYYNQPCKQTSKDFVHRKGGQLVRGRVVDKETSEPIPEATVRLSWYNQSGPSEYFSKITNSDGKFEIRVPEKTYAVSCQAKGHIPYGRSNVYPPQNTLTVDANTAQNEFVIEMEPGLAAKFIVTEANGNPVEGANVNIHASGAEGDGTTDAKGECLIDTLPKVPAIALVTKTWGKQLDQYAGGRLYSTAQQRQSRTNGDTGGRPASRAYTEPFEPGPQDNPTVVKVTLGESASVSGHVTYKESGEPVKKRRIFLDITEISTALGGSMSGGTETDDNGFYGIQELAPGKYGISVQSKTSYKRLASSDITLKPGEHRTDLDFVVDEEPDATEVVEGKVVNESGEPVPFAMVHLFTRDPKKPNESISRSGDANENGEFKLENLPKADELSLFVHADGYSEIMGKKYPMNGEFLTITLKPTGIIAGVVLKKDPRIPVAGAKVSVQMNRGGTVYTDANGQFEIKGVQPGTYKVAAEAEGFSRTEAPEIKLEAGESVRDVVNFMN
ncbi:MAG: carboxypeptidase regulatory-like domain-containing protein [bacterium]